jgi:preprotein translocase subunit YajC
MDIYTLGLIVVFGALLAFMFYNNRKRQKQQQDLQAKMQPGTEVMTSFGLFGVLRSVDEETNVAEVESTPGTIVRVHRQTLTRVVDPTASTAATTATDVERPAEVQDADIETPTASETKPVDGKDL